MAQSNMRHARRPRRRLKVGGTGRIALVACVAAAVLALVAFVVGEGSASSFEVRRSDGGSAATSSTSAASPQASADVSATCVVHVDGAVANPGVYTLTGEVVRVNDAVSAAGGLLEDADTAGINLASPVVDGSKVHIPHADEDASSAVSAAGAASEPTGLVNINSADTAALDTLPGVGASTAQSIVKDREQNGPFTSVEDLMRVSGIGQKKFDKIKDLICV